ncbi:MAG TPA: right-handed parallel beta-helix repeat-containing protein, partial [Sphingomonas sp.]|nr:right-handed parallel beta-helix repeat-containing protein [Sphingomonas sp.]
MSYITVTTDTELAAAISKAVGGDTVYLAPGSYTSLSLANKAYTTPVTFTSLDASRPAHIDGISINNAQNATLSHLDVGRALKSTELDHTALSQIRGSSNITLDGLKLHGSLDGNPLNDGTLLTVAGSKGITISNSEFTEATRGATFGTSSNLTLLNNNVHMMRTDGFDFASVQHVLVQGNRIGGFMIKAGDHPDAIQFWTSGTTVASSDITI